MKSIGRFVLSLVVLAMAFIPALALAQQGGIEPKDLKLEIRRFGDGLSRIGIPSSSEVTVGTNGVVVAPQVPGDAGYVEDAGVLSTDASIGADAAALDGSSDFVTTAATIGPIPLSSALEVVMIDANADDTVACSSVYIGGFDAWGFKTGETVTTVSETAKYTTTAFSEITSVRGTGCSGATDSGDILRVSSSLKVALPVKIRQVADIEAVCVDDTSGADLNCFTGTLLDSYGAVSMSAFIVDLSDADVATAVGTSVATGDGVFMRVRPWPARP